MGSPMSAVLGFLLLLLLLPLIAMAAGIALYLLALTCAIACPILLFLARNAAEVHHWAIMWQRLGESLVCGAIAFAVLRPLMNSVAAMPPSCPGHPYRSPQFGDYLRARTAGVTLRAYMRRRYQSF
jgi:hypothetical protein